MLIKWASLSNSLFEKIFLSTNISVGSTSDLPEAPAKIAAYKAKLDKLLATDYTDALIKNGRQAKASLSGSKAGTERELAKIDGYLKQVRDKNGMEYMYYTIQFQNCFKLKLSVCFCSICDSFFLNKLQFYMKIKLALKKLIWLFRKYIIE